MKLTDPTRLRISKICLAALIASAPMLTASGPTAAAPKPTIAKPAATKPASPPFRPSTITRDILALYDSANEPTPADTRIHNRLEMPLNHLGYRVVFHDIKTGLPDPSTLNKYAAVATWFDERVPDFRSYLSWATRAASKGTRFIVIDFLGSPLEDDDLEASNSFLSHLGLKARAQWIPPEAKPEITSKDGSIFGFEGAFDVNVNGFMVMTADPKRATSHLALTASDNSEPGAVVLNRSDVVVTGPGGGFIQYGFAENFNDKTERHQWLTNPFAFLVQALGHDQKIHPAPDVTTLAGRRIFFSHIDGDGWNNVSEVVGPSGNPFAASEVIRDRLIKAFPTLPIAIGLIAADISRELGGTAQASLTARDLFEMKNVEVASHTYTHPYQWAFFEKYSREEELRLHRARDSISAKDADRPGEILPLLRSGNDNGGTDMPRANYVEPFDLTKEIAGALEVSAALAPANKKPKLYLWSGDTSPFEAALAATRDAAVRNMNGGDTRLDKNYPSIAYVPAISRPVGKQRQIYAVNSNENTYTNGFTTNFGALATVTETWANTDSPRRLKAMNVYYHMFSGQKSESVAAIETLMKIGRDTAVMPIHASQYAAIADSFFTTEIRQNSPSSWSIYTRGSLDTIRFDHADANSLDLAASLGVLGYTKHNTSLYVALDPAVTEPRITLNPPGMPDAASAAPPIPYLIESRWQIARLERGDCGFSARSSGFGNGEMTWRGLYEGRYTISVNHLDGSEAYTNIRDVDSSGELRLALPVDAVAGVDIKLSCMFAPAVQSVVAPVAATPSPPLEAISPAPVDPNQNGATAIAKPPKRKVGPVKASKGKILRKRTRSD